MPRANSSSINPSNEWLKIATAAMLSSLFSIALTLALIHRPMPQPPLVWAPPPAAALAPEPIATPVPPEQEAGFEPEAPAPSSPYSVHYHEIVVDQKTADSLPETPPPEPRERLHYYEISVRDR